MDLESLINELEDLLQRAIHFPGGKALVDEATVRQILNEMRGAASDQVQARRQIANEQERILADAKAQALRITEEARTQLNARLDDQAMVHAVRQRTKDIQIEAEQRAAALRAETNQYVVGQLGALEARLQRVLREVQAGQHVLGQERHEQTDSGGES